MLKWFVQLVTASFVVVVVELCVWCVCGILGHWYCPKEAECKIVELGDTQG